MSAAPPHPEQQPVDVEVLPTAPETELAPEEEIASETLYIQNLNERIQIPGAIAIRCPFEVANLPDHFTWDYSPEGILTWSLQIIWRGP